MKKTFAFFAAFLLVVSFGYAQEIRIAPVVGVTAATSLKSSYIKNQLKETKREFEEDNPGLKWSNKNVPLPGLLIGGLVDYAPNDNLSFQSGLLFNMRGESRRIRIKGTDQNGDRSNAKAKYSFRLSYLEIPLWVRFPVGDNGLKLTVGPNFGLAVGGKARVKTSGQGFPAMDESEKLSVGSDPLENTIKPFDISLNLALGKEFQLGNAPLEITAFVQPSVTTWNTASKLNADNWYRNVSAGIRAAYYLSIR